MARSVLRREVLAVGAQLAHVAVARWAPHITDRAFRVLMRMALTARDVPRGGTPAATYFGGDELLLLTFSEGKRESKVRSVRRAIADLISVGAIERIRRGNNGSRAVYRLTLDNDPTPVDNSPAESVKGDTGVMLRVTAESVKGDSSVTPMCKYLLLNEGSTPVEDSRTDRARANQHDEPDSSMIRQSSYPTCAQCGTYLEMDGSCDTCNGGGIGDA